MRADQQGIRVDICDGVQAVGLRAGEIAGLACLGLLAALMHTHVKLSLGLPGHAALKWLLPLLLARRLLPLGVAGTVASSAAAAGLLVFNGFGLRWPLLGSAVSFWLVGPALDALERTLGPEAPGLRGLPFAMLTGVVGNFAHFGLKLTCGIYRAHGPRFGMSPWLWPCITYAFFGLLAGAAAHGLWHGVRAARRQPSRRADGFTLIELLVVVSIIAILAALLLPTLVTSRELARRTQSKNNLDEVGKGLEIYAGTCKGYFPAWHAYGSLAQDVRYFDRHGCSRVPDVANAQKSGIYGMRTLATAKKEQGGPHAWQAGALVRCPIGLGLLMVDGGTRDGLVFRCPSSCDRGPEAIWKRLGGRDEHALIHGYDRENNQQQNHVSSSYNYRNMPIDLVNDLPRELPGTRPRIQADPNCPPFKTQRRLASRAICCDSFDRDFVDGDQDGNRWAGRGAKSHGDGYNALYGDWHVAWMSDP